MEHLSSFSVPKAISFEQAIALTQSLLLEIEQGRLSETELESIITALVQSENGVRGFFVAYLSDERAIADSPSNAMIQGLRSSPELVSEFLVKNLAMSTAMIVTHRTNGNLELVAGSERVQRRTKGLMEVVRLAEVRERSRKLQETLETGVGEYQAFLDRWGYDEGQRLAIREQVEKVLEDEFKG